MTGVRNADVELERCMEFIFHGNAVAGDASVHAFGRAFSVKYFVLCCDFVINLFNSQLKDCRASACCFGIWDPTRLLNLHF